MLRCYVSKCCPTLRSGSLGVELYSMLVLSISWSNLTHPIFLDEVGSISPGITSSSVQVVECPGDWWLRSGDTTEVFSKKTTRLPNSCFPLLEIGTLCTICFPVHQSNELRVSVPAFSQRTHWELVYLASPAHPDPGSFCWAILRKDISRYVSLHSSFIEKLASFRLSAWKTEALFNPLSIAHL